MQLGVRCTTLRSVTRGVSHIIVLHCTVPYHTVPYYTISYSNLLYCTPPHLHVIQSLYLTLPHHGVINAQHIMLRLATSRQSEKGRKQSVTKVNCFSRNEAILRRIERYYGYKDREEIIDWKG